MQTASNIHQLAEASKYLEFFYNEELDTGLLHCNPCFKMQITARPTLNNLSPFQAQRIINSCASVGDFGNTRVTGSYAQANSKAGVTCARSAQIIIVIVTDFRETKQYSEKIVIVSYY